MVGKGKEMKSYTGIDGSISFLRIPEDIKKEMIQKIADVLQVNFMENYARKPDEFLRLACEGFSKVENMCLMEYDSVHFRAVLTGTFTYNWFREFLEPKTKRKRKRKERKNATNRSKRNRKLFNAE